MSEKLVIGPINKGLRLDREPFFIDNDSFPTLINAYQWRGRVKRKRGTDFLGRLNRYISVSVTLSSGTVNLVSALTLESNATIVPGSISLVGGTDGTTYTDPNKDGTLSVSGGTGTGGTINYSTGVISINSGGAETLTGNIKYYPNLPVMGIRDFRLQPDTTNVPATCICFDTKYSYEVSSTLGSGGTYPIYSVSYFKNPPSNISPYSGFTGYTPKANATPVTWAGADYRQIWTTNYSGAMWATDASAGMQYEARKTLNASRNDANTVTFTFKSSGTFAAIEGDFIFVNEWSAGTAANANTLNFQTGYVISGSSSTSLKVYFPNASIASDTYSNGMIQYLSTIKDSSVSGIRFYDGDPTSGATNLIPTTCSTGWVNYAPPLSQGTFSINATPSDYYYLVGATMIYPFRDFLLFVGAYIQTSDSGATPIWLQDTVIFAQNGTPYYTATFNQGASSAFLITTSYTAIMVPSNETAYPMSTWEDVTGFGGYIASGVAQPITTLVPNEDVLILGYPEAFTRLIYTGNNLIPFLFYRINSELGSNCTFGAVIFDKGSWTVGNFGICLTTQVASQRVDLSIPDQVFKITYLNNGYRRVTAGRDYLQEWLYISYPLDGSSWSFPTQTLFYNYRDDSWAIFNETYTCYGEYYKQTGNTWAYIDDAWGGYTETWDSSVASVGNADLVGGNQQGFLLIRNDTVDEDTSLYISNIDPSTNTITSPNHCLNVTDPVSGTANYVVFSGVLGSINSGGSSVNGQIFRILSTPDANTFTVYPSLDSSGTYSGGGYLTKYYVPFIQSKQFPVSWAMSRKTTLGPQMYLFTATSNGQVTVNIYLSTASNSSFNVYGENDAIIFKQVVYTCPESTNLGLTPANVSLQQIINVGSDGKGSSPQKQIWHRMNTSLIGDVVQIGITLSDDQMLDSTFSNQYAEIEFHSAILDVKPSGYLA